MNQPSRLIRAIQILAVASFIGGFATRIRATDYDVYIDDTKFNPDHC